MMRSFDEIQKLIRDTGTSPRSPNGPDDRGHRYAAQHGQPGDHREILIIRDALDRIEHQLAQADPHFNAAGELQRTPAELDLLPASFRLLGDQLGMLVTAAGETKAP